MTRKEQLREVIFGTDTRSGKGFDLALLVAISASVLVVMLDSVESFRLEHERLLITAEWIFTVIFTIEYGLRLYCARSARKYAFSFFGMVDLLSIIPTYLTLIITGTHYLAVIRVLRILRMFRVLKMVRHVSEGSTIIRALLSSRAKITVFIFAVLCMMVIMGTLMYMIEGEQNGFTNIPQSIYWAIVTITTVGYGDVSPDTPAGKLLASFAMLIGYAIIAVPTGIITVELQRENRRHFKSCERCGNNENAQSARYCHQCGERIIAADTPREA